MRGKIKFLAQRVLTAPNAFDESRTYTLDMLEQEGLCDAQKCKKCLPFRMYIKLLRKYMKKSEMKEKSKIMQVISKHESHMLVPRKYHIHKQTTDLKTSIKTMH